MKLVPRIFLFSGSCPGLVTIGAVYCTLKDAREQGGVFITTQELVKVLLTKVEHFHGLRNALPSVAILTQITMTIEFQPVIFPNEPQFKRLVQHCLESPDQVAVYDKVFGIVASYEQLLRDIEATRRLLVKSLPRSMFDTNQAIISKDQTLFVAVLAPGNYEFLVAALAVLATGGAFVPLCEWFELKFN